MVLPSKLAIFVTFQFAEKPLASLRSICREFPSQGDQMKDYLSLHQRRPEARHN